MLDKLATLADRYEELTEQLSQPEVIQDTSKFQQISKDHAQLQPIFELYMRLAKIEKEIEENQFLSQDPQEDIELREIAKEECLQLKKEREQLIYESKILLLPKDPNDNKNIIMEIRAGTGGDEAGLFVGDLFKLYRKFSESNGWKLEIMESHLTEVGGFKEISFLIEGKNVYSRLKYEAGTHRVQRVPTTETQGRIHTSAVTVAILPEAEDVEVDINSSDLRIDTYRSQGAGGQHVNTTDSAIRITHIPTGVVVTCQEERSQIKNKAKALKHLKAKLYEIQQIETQKEEAALRKTMVGSGDRSERIRTYNYPQGRITDHRVKLTLYKLEDIMNTGNLSEIIDVLANHEQAEKLKANE